MNPPFANGVDVKHIEHALRFLKPGGRLVAICANGPRQRAALMDHATHWEDLPAGTFRDAGPGIAGLQPSPRPASRRRRRGAPTARQA